MNFRGGITAFFVVASLVLFDLTTAALAEEGHLIHLIYPFDAGGSGYALSRIVADEISAALSRPVIIEPRPGAAGRIGVQAVKAAEPDGDTLLITPIAPMVIYPSIYPQLAYDPVQDFRPVAQLAVFDFAVAVGNDVPVRTLADLVAWLKANPSRANYGIPGTGTLPHFFGVMFAHAIDVPMQPVPYRGTVAALTDLIGGRIPLMFHASNELLEMQKAGTIRVLATSNAQRSTFLPDVPTFREAGFDLVGSGWFALFAPAGTPLDVVDRLSAIVVAALAKADVKDRIRVLGLEPTGTSAQALRQIQLDDIARWAPAVKASGFVAPQ